MALAIHTPRCTHSISTKHLGKEFMIAINVRAVEGTQRKIRQGLGVPIFLMSST
jgi:hypothetical protein